MNDKKKIIKTLFDIEQQLLILIDSIDNTEAKEVIANFIDNELDNLNYELEEILN